MRRDTIILTYNNANACVLFVVGGMSHLQQVGYFLRRYTVIINNNVSVCMIFVVGGTLGTEVNKHEHEKRSLSANNPSLLMSHDH